MTSIDADAEAAADAFRAVRLTADEKEALWSYTPRSYGGDGQTGWAPWVERRTGLPLVALLGRSGIIDMGTGPRPLGGDRRIAALAVALRAKPPAEAWAFVAECRATAQRVRRGGESAVASKLIALANLAQAIIEPDTAPA